MQRWDQQELLDGQDVSDEVLTRSYRELQMLHWWLGNTSALLRSLRRSPTPLKRVLDIGCGQGGLLLEIRKRFRVDVVGFDLRRPPPDSPIPIASGNAVLDLLPEADVAVCVMMVHHLSEDELVRLIRNVSRSCQRLVILDLVRHHVPLWLFRIFVAPFLGRINGRDGVTSIRRAFTAREMSGIVAAALKDGDRPVRRVRHLVSPFWTRQMVDIFWEGIPAEA